MISNDRGRFLPIARIHRARETILEQALRIAAIILNRCEKNITHSNELTCFDLRTIAARSERDNAISNASLAAEKVKGEYEIYRQLMKKLMREHEYVEAALKQHRGETRRHQQKIEIASEEVISDSLRPATLAALSF
jgi:hypothetical protein